MSRLQGGFVPFTSRWTMGDHLVDVIEAAPALRLFCHGMRRGAGGAPFQGQPPPPLTRAISPCLVAPQREAGPGGCRLNRESCRVDRTRIGPNRADALRASVNPGILCLAGSPMCTMLCIMRVVTHGRIQCRCAAWRDGVHNHV